APGSGPMFKSTTVTVKENEISQRVVVDSVNNQQDFKYNLIHSEANTKDVTTVPADPGNTNNYTTKNNRLGDQAQGIHRHKIGFSFAFPKKASVKLESSAAAFSEYNDDASVEKEFSRKSRFVPSTCHIQLSSPTDVLLNSGEKATSFHPPEAMHTVKETAQTQEIKEVPSEKDTLSLSSFCQLQLPLSSDTDNSQNLVPLADQIPLEDVIIDEDIPVSSNNSELLGNKSTVLNMTNDCILVQAITEENVKNNDVSTIENENKNGPESLVPSSTEENNITLNKKSGLYKRQCEPFVPVLNKHGSTVLQWPSEMLAYTTIEPSISYSCNPLCFDFKSTKLNNNLDKNKLLLNCPYSQQKEDIYNEPVSDCKDLPNAGLTDCETGSSKNEYTQDTPLLPDDTLTNNCESRKNENMDKRYKNISYRHRRAQKCNFTKNQAKQDTLDEKYNKIRLKDTHEQWFHKSRRKKKRRKLCQHHHGEKTKDTETHCKMEMENSYTDTTRKNLLEPISEKQYVAEEHLLDSHKSSDKRPKSVYVDLSENEEIHKTCNTEYNNNGDISSKNHCKKNTILLNGQSNQTMIHSGERNLTYSRTYCCWKARLSSCSQDHRCFLLQNDTQCVSQNHPVKRGYNSLMNETERFHRKRRQHSCSYSSDESLNRQNYLPDEFLKPPSSSAAPCRFKKKRRRKRSRFHPRGETLEIKENIDYHMKRSSSLNHLDGLISEDKIEEKKPQEVANIERNSEQGDQVKNKLVLHSSSSLPFEARGESAHLEMETTLRELPEVSKDSTASVSTASVPTKQAVNNTLLEHKERGETTNVNEKQIPFKVPNIERNFRQSQPKSYLCHCELAEALPQGKMNEASTTEWLCYNSGILNTQPPLPFKEAQVSGHTFVTTEQILAPLALPEQTLLIPLENHNKFKNLPCEVYQHIIQPNMLANKVKLTFPPPPLPPPSTPLQPLPLQQPLCSTSVTTIHHTVLQQHAAAAAAAGTFKVLQPHQQFLSQVPALARTSIPQIAVGPAGPRLCPGNQPTFLAPSPMPIIPASALHPSHLAFPPLPHAFFPSLLSPHPTVIPLQPLF
uniref:Zinc finger protein 804A n=1 Tax=Castor canadensis TaxID=51338 RepID=A0A8B7TUV7_CASCN